MRYTHRQGKNAVHIEIYTQARNNVVHTEIYTQARNSLTIRSLGMPKLNSHFHAKLEDAASDSSKHTAKQDPNT